MLELMTKLDYPEDIVIATGEARSVRDLCRCVFDKLGLNYEDHITINKRFLQPQELPYLRGDRSKSKELLDWEPQYSLRP